MIRVNDLSIQQGTFSLSGIQFEVPQGKYGILMGRTGSGKTTILEAICGLKPSHSGEITLQDKNVTKLKPAERGIGFVPQDGAIFPTMSVRRQIGFALRVRKVPEAVISQRVADLAGLLQIPHLLERMPEGLSGGERQRIALGRALAASPALLCLDEPLSAVDEETRLDLCDLLKSVQRQTGITALHITHSLEEAERLGDVIFQIQEGQVIRKEQKK